MISQDGMHSETELSERGIANNIPQLPNCTICGGQTVKRFSKEFNGMTVDYFHCSVCGHLVAGHITAAPRYDGGDYFKEIDAGWEERNGTILGFIRFLMWLPGIGLSGRSTVLDFGCGRGRLVSDLNQAGFHACGFEPYPESEVPSKQLFTDWEEAKRTLGRVDLITCIEVLEHFRDPDEFMQKVSEVLAPRGYLLISTGIFESSFHDADWYYLSPAAGHVSIFSENSLRILFKRYQFEPVLRGSGIAWLFRSVATRRRSSAERGYFALSQLRVWGKFQIARLARKFIGADWRPPEFVRRLWGNL